MNKYITEKMIESNLSSLNQLIFEVTDACNLKCKYCGYGELYYNHDERKNENFQVEKAIILLEYLKHYWLSNLNTSYMQETYISFYGGEPLLNLPFIKKVISWINANPVPHKKFSFSMTTNGVLLDRYIDFLVSNNFRILISLDGDEDSHSYRINHTGRNSFKKVFSNIKLLQNKYPDYFDSNVSFNAVLHNKNSVQGIYDFIKKEFGKIPKISELNTSGIDDSKKELFWKTFKNKLESLQQAENFIDIENNMFFESPLNHELATYLFQYSGNVFRNYSDLLANENELKLLNTGTCTPFGRKMFVTVNGKILPCERVGYQYCLGRLYDNISIDINAISSNYNSYFDKMSILCENCYFNKLCDQCIFQLNLNFSIPTCPNYMDKKKFIEYLSNQIGLLEKHPKHYFDIFNRTVGIKIK